MIPMNCAALAKACDGRLVGGDAGLQVTGLCTDSRKVRPGDLFVALRGERADGHTFLPQVFEKGAACALVECVPEPLMGPCILVADTALAIQRAAGLYRSFFQIPIVGITGSVGKTTAKEMCAAVLAQRWRVHKTEGNFNNNLGVPLTIFGLEPEDQAAVVEMGISHFGEMTELARTVRPSHVLMTNIGSAHLEALGSREGILKAKSEIFQFADPAGTAFLNGDDVLLRDLRPPMAGCVLYGLGENCQVRGIDVRSQGTKWVDFTLVWPGGRKAIRIPGYGEHLVYGALAAAALGLHMGLGPEEIAAGIGDYQPAGRRARVLETGKLRLIDDCYNANPASMQAALRSLATLPGRRVAILGDMRELGKEEVAFHQTLGRFAKELGLDGLLFVGPLSQAAAQAAGAPWFPDKAALAAALPDYVQPGDTVLIKASRGMEMETVTEMLQAL